MNTIWVVLFIVSFLLLLLVLLRGKGAFQALGYVALNVVVAAFLLYFIDLFSDYTHFRIPINMMTVLTVGILGVPGLLLLIAIKLLII